MDCDAVKNVYVATLVPGAAFVVGMTAFTTDESLVKWFQDLKRPSHAPNSLWPYVVGNALTAAPVFYSYHHLYSITNGFEGEEAQLALASYGLTVVVGMSGFVCLHRRSVSGMFMQSAATTVASYLMAYFFHKVDPAAGHMVFPLCLWLSYGTFLKYHIARMNLDGGDD